MLRLVGNHECGSGQLSDNSVIVQMYTLRKGHPIMLCGSRQTATATHVTSKAATPTTTSRPSRRRHRLLWRWSRGLPSIAREARDDSKHVRRHQDLGSENSYSVCSTTFSIPTNIAHVMLTIPPIERPQHLPKRSEQKHMQRDTPHARKYTLICRSNVRQRYRSDPSRCSSSAEPNRLDAYAWSTGCPSTKRTAGKLEGNQAQQQAPKDDACAGINHHTAVCSSIYSPVRGR